MCALYTTNVPLAFELRCVGESCPPSARAWKIAPCPCAVRPFDKVASEQKEGRKTRHAKATATRRTPLGMRFASHICQDERAAHLAGCECAHRCRWIGVDECSRGGGREDPSNLIKKPAPRCALQVVFERQIFCLALGRGMLCQDPCSSHVIPRMLA